MYLVALELMIKSEEKDTLWVIVELPVLAKFGLLELEDS